MENLTGTTLVLYVIIQALILLSAYVFWSMTLKDTLIKRFPPLVNHLITASLYVVPCMICICIYMFTPYKNELLRVSSYFMMGITALFLFRGRIVSKLVVLIYVIISLSIADMSCAIAAQVMGYSESAADFVKIACTGCLMVYNGLNILFAVIWNQYRKQSLSKRSLIFILIPASQLLTFYASCNFIQTATAGENRLLLWEARTPVVAGAFLLVGLILSLFADIIVFRGFMEINRLHEVQAKMELDNYRSEINYMYYNDLKENAQEMSHIRHDLDNVLQSMTVLLAVPDTQVSEHAKQIYDELTERVSHMKYHTYCSNELISAIVSAKQELCENNNITTEYVLTVGNDLPGIEELDLCRALVNLLDNAIEACCKTEDGRRLSLCVKTIDGMLLIRVDNSFNGEIISENNELKTTKADAKHHGMGTHVVAQVAQKYHGDYITQINGDTFTAILSMKLQ